MDEQLCYIYYDDQIQYQIMIGVVQNVVYVVGVMVCVFIKYVVKLVEEVGGCVMVVFLNGFQYCGVQCWCQD